MDELSTRQNVRELESLVQIDTTILGLFGERLKYADLINGIGGRISLTGIEASQSNLENRCRQAEKF